MFDIRAKMKLGIVHPMLFPQTQSGRGPIYQTMEKIVQDPFFDCIEISWIKNDTDRKKIANLLRMGQMDIVYTQGIISYAKSLNPHSLELRERKRSVQEIKRSIDEALFLGARIFQMIGGSDPGPSMREDARRHFVESLCSICEYALHNGSGEEMIISIENLDRNVHKRFFIGPTSEAARVIETVKKDFPNIGLTLDLAHLPLLGESFKNAVNSAKEHLVHVHLGNCILRDSEHPRYGDNHPPLGIEGGEIGVCELAEFLNELANIGFFDATDNNRPIVSFEVKPAGNESPEILIAATKRIFFQACSNVLCYKE